MVDLSLVKPKDLWYVVGLIATDGNLSKDGRHISIVSKDNKFLRKVRKALLLKNKIGFKANGIHPEKIYFVLQIGDKKFFNFLLSIGLIPKKSLILDKLSVPKNYFTDFLRGVIDGDGTIVSWVHKSNGNKQWSVRIYSAASKFVHWLKNETEKIYRVSGKIYGYKHGGRKNTYYQIKFGKFASKVILEKCYYDKCLAIDRKYNKAIQCLKSKDGLSKYGTVVQN